MKRFCGVKGLSAFMAVLLLTGGCGSAAATETPQEEAAVAVEAVSAEIGTLTISNVFVGTVSPQQQVSIIPLVSGEVDAVYFDVGDEVKAGDVLFHIDDEAAALQLKNAQLSRQSAEISAQKTLGSSQVLSNLSMQSNLKSIQYQIDMAKEQYNTAANGVSDSEEAKEDLDEAIDKINDSVKDLEGSYDEMRDMAAAAKQCVEQNDNGVWRFKVLYDNDWLSPDKYDWAGVTSTGQDDADDVNVNHPSVPNDGLSNGVTKEPSGADGGAADPTVPDDGPSDSGSTEESTGTSGGAADSGEGEQEPESETEETGQSQTTKPSDDASSEKPVKETSSGTEDDKKPVENGTAADTDKQEDSDSKSKAQASGSGKLWNGQTDAYAWFSVEQVIEENPVYLADTSALETVPEDLKREYDTFEKAMAAYVQQQKINAMEAAIRKMGYNAADVGEGRVDEAIQQYASQIASMKSQAASLEGNKSSLDSSIKSAETSRDTTKKTIDFYEDNLRDAQTQYGIQNGQAYQDTAAAMAAQLQTADLGIESARLQLEYYTVSAPISGTIISKSIDEFGMAQPGYAACVISNQDAMNVVFYVSEAVKNTLHPGMTVNLERNGITYEAAITEIGTAVDAQTGLFSIKAVTDVGGDTLSSGVTVKITADTHRTDGAILIPYDAVYFESEQAYVFVVKDGRAVRTPVETGLYNETMIEIKQGLSPDSQVIKTWSSQLEDGAAVRVIGQNAGKTVQETTPAVEESAVTEESAVEASE